MSTTVEFPRTTANRILKALPLEEYERLSADLEPVSMPLGEILCHPDEPITHVYFPNRGTFSLVSNFEDGTSIEVGMVGNEGMFGVCVFLGSISTPLFSTGATSGRRLGRFGHNSNTRQFTFGEAIDLDRP